MMAVVDGDYKFTYVEVGTNGTSSDAQIFEDCGLKVVIDQRVIGFPPPDLIADWGWRCQKESTIIAWAIAKESTRMPAVSWPIDMPVYLVW